MEIDTNDGTWMVEGGARRRDDSWREIDGALRDIARRRGALDAEEARLLCRAVRGEIWRQLGKVSAHEYLEEVLGYSPRAARERVRVALALDELPELADALAAGELAFSAIRELTRIATPATQRAWRDDARGKNLRQIELAVSGRRRGDLPSDPPDPDLGHKVLSFRIRPATYAHFRRAQQALAGELGSFGDDDSLIGALASAALERTTGTDTSGRAKYQVMTVLCETCSQGWHEGGGVKVAIDAADTARVLCDAQWIGSNEAPARASQDVPPRTWRFVRRRDEGRCCVPGCRAARFIELHHIVPRAEGGTHAADNLTLLCDGHHRALHEGKLSIRGKAPALDVRWAHHEPAATHVGRTEGPAPDGIGPSSEVDALQREPIHVGHAVSSTPPWSTAPSMFALVARKAEAKQALVTLRFSKSEATAAVDAAATRVGPDATLEELLREALRCCPRPTR